MRKKMDQLAIRSKQAGDIDFICGLAERCFAPYSRNPGQSMRSMLLERGLDVAIAEIGGAPVGFVLVGFQRLSRDFGPWKRPAVAHLDAIAVRPESQGRGAGLGLLTWAEDITRLRGAVSISLNTAEDNVRARRLFEAAGFVCLAPILNNYIDGQTGIAMIKVL